MKKIYLILLTTFFAMYVQAQNVNVNPGAGSYATLKAAFDAINLGTHTGTITVDIVGNTTETLSAVLNASGAGAASYTSITISPSGGAARTITGAITGHLIDLNGADNVTIDGLNTTGNSLSISNTATGASSTVRFIGDATNNTVQKTTLQGSTTSFGVVFLSTGTTTGNDGNNINNCNITGAGANLPLNGIYSLGTGTVGIENSGITINANNISDYFSAASATSGMNINTGNTTWTITANKLFQSATRIYTTAATHNGIVITTGDGYTITGNTIGFANNAGTGTTNMVGNTVALTGTFPSSYTTTGTANATRYIALNCTFNAAGTVSSIQNNTIAGFALYTSSGATTTTGVFCGIAVAAGNANIGTTTGNTIGSTTGNGSIYTASTTTGALAAGIYATTSNTISIQNNTIGAIDAMGTTSSLSGSINGINAAGSGSVTVSGNIIGNSTNPNLRMGNLTTGANLSNAGTTFGIASGAGAFKGILAASTGTTKLIGTTSLPNTIRNASLNSSSASATFRGIENSGAGVAVISSNSISNITSASTSVSVASGGLAGLGIYLSAGTSCVVNANSITGLSLSSTGTGGYNIGGISYTFPTTSIAITNNKICDLSNASTSVTTTTPGTASGIFIRDGGGSINNISNNMIALGNGQTTNTTFMGIWVQYGLSTATTLKIYHNTFDVEGTVSTGAQPSFGIYRGDFTATAVTVFTMDIKNNILINNRSGGTGKHYAIANNYGATASAIGWGANASNYNVLNGTAANIGYWTTDKTFAAWQTASAGDGNSLTAIPVTFVGACDLHLNMGVTSTQLESGGISGLGIATDIDGQARPGPAGSVNGGAAAPDLGADEFDGVPLDLSPPSISYTALGNTTVGTNQTLTATITDASGVPTNGAGLPVLYYKINAGAYTAVVGTSIGSNQYTFTFGAATTLVGDVVSYYIVAQDGAATPNVGSFPSAGAGGFTANPPAASTPPTTPSSFVTVASISGSFNVGTGEVYTSLTNAGGAFAGINGAAVTGNIVLNITTDLTAESGLNALNQFASPFTVTINPVVAARTISGALASAALIKLNGADRVTINGSVGGAGTDKSLTITNTSITSPTAIALISLGTGAGANTNTIKNCNISTGVSAATGFGIAVGGTTPGSNGADNDNVTIQNNTITIATIPIYAIGTAAVSAGGNDNLVITGNTVTTTTTIQNFGIQVGNGLNSSISQNTVSVETSGSVQPVGISLETGFNNSTVSKNVITKVLTTATGGYGGRGITVGSGMTGSNITLSNNMISGVNGSNFSGFGNSSSMGIGVGLVGSSTTLTTITGGVNIYFNSINLTGNHSYTSATNTAGLYVGSGVTVLDVRNNIFANSLNNTTTIGSKDYAIYSAAAPAAFTNINYNDYFGLSSTNSTALVGFISSADQATLAAWKTATAQDVNSVSGNPNYTSASDLHINTALPTILDGTATPIAGITSDIDGDTRNATTPDIGADEITIVGCAGQPAAGSITPTTASRCVGQTYSLTATGLTVGAGITYQWQVATVTGGPYADVTGGTGATTTSYTTGTLTSGLFYYVLKTTCSTSGQTNVTNELALTVNALPTVSVSPTSASFCSPGGTPVVLTASGASTYAWSPAAGLSQTNTPSVSASPTVNTTYTVTGTDGNGCTNTATSTITVLAAPVISSVTATPTTVCSGGNSQLQANVTVSPASYSFASGTGAVLETIISPVTVTTTTSGSVDDGSNEISPAGFSFSYAGTVYTGFSAVTNGWLKMLATATTNIPSSLTSAGANGIYAFGRDANLNIANGGNLTHGFAAGNKYVFQFTNNSGGASGAVSATAYLNAQIVLWGSTSATPGKIEIIYGSSLGTPASQGTIGISNSAGSYFNAVTGNNSALTTVAAYPASGTIYTFIPPALTYSWTPTTGLSDPTIANPVASNITANTTYNVSVSNGTCTSTGSVTVNLATYNTSVVTQPSTAAVTAGSTNNIILLIDAPQACTAENLTQLNFTNASTVPADVSVAKVYYNTTNSFATATLFGTTATPGATFTVTGSQALSTSTRNYIWLVYDIACNAGNANTVDGGITSFVVGAGTFTPTPSNPPGTRTITGLATSILTTQPSIASVQGGNTNQQVLRVEIPATSCGPVTSFTFNTNGSTNAATDISKARVFYTTTTTFTTTTQFGTDAINPNGSFIITGSQVLSTTLSNYFWLVYDINCAATAANVVDAEVNSVTTGGTAYTPTTINPTGTRAIVAATTYTTVANGDWSSSATWACGNIPPSNTTAVTIAHNITVTTGGNVAGNVTVNAGASLSVSAGDLTLGGSSLGALSGNSNKLLQVDGTLTLSGGTLNLNGAATFATASVFNMSAGVINVDPNDGTAGGSSTATGGFIINTPTLNLTGGNINFLDPMYTATAGTGQTVLSYNHASLDVTTGATVFTFGGGDDQNPLNVNGFYVECNIGTGTLEIGNAVVAGGRFANQRELTSRQAATNYITKFKNLTVNAGAEVTLTAGSAPFSITGNLVNNGVITNAGATTASGMIFADAQYSAGVVLNPLSTGQTISGSGFFKKSTADADPTAQTGNIIGSLSIYHLNTSPGVTLNLPITVTNNLRLLRGKVNTTTVNFLALGNGTSIPGNAATLTATTGTLDGFTFTPLTSAAYDGGHVIGTFNRWVTATTTTGQQGLMPVGSDTSKPAQILFTVAPTTAGYLTATWVNGTGTSTISPALNEPAVTPSTIDLVLNPYWKIQNLGTLTGGTYTSRFTFNNASNVVNFANTTLLKRIDGGTVADWVIQGTHIATTGSNAYPTVSRSGLTTFSEFSIGGNANAVLPVTIEFFRGSKLAAANYLDWKVTCTSQPSVQLTLERSADGRNFTAIDDQTATATRCLQGFNYTDNKPLAGFNYYRLKTTSPDGKIGYSTIVVLLNKEKGFELISLAPNPVKTTSILSLTTVKGGKIDISVSDLTGKVISKQSVVVIAGNNPITMNFAALGAGTYIITAVNAEGELKTTRFVKF